MHNSWVFYYFFQKSIFTENYFLIAVINLATRGPLYTCLVPFTATKCVLLDFTFQISLLLHYASLYVEHDILLMTQAFNATHSQKPC